MNAIKSNDGVDIRVKEKLAQVNACPGVEGIADFFLCEVLDADGEMLSESILCIFVARFEEFSLKLVCKNPDRYNSAEEVINEMLELVSKEYLLFSNFQKSHAPVLH